MIIDCPSCSSSFSCKVNAPKVCKCCGINIDELHTEEGAGSREADLPDLLQAARQARDYSGLSGNELEEIGALEEAERSVVLTTTSFLPGVDDYDVVEVIVAEAVLGMNAFRDISAGVRDFVGGRSGSAEKILRAAKQMCLSKVRREAVYRRTNAVIGVELTFNAFGDTMLFVVASGTAIRTKGLTKNGNP